MFKRMLIVVLLGTILTGCATNTRKNERQLSLSSTYEDSQRAYQEEIYIGDSEQIDKTYEQATQKTSSKPVQLSAKQIQRALKNAGFYQGAIDGKIGPKTKAAIIKFQKTNGLKSDGIVGKKTSTELNKYLSR